MGGRRSGSLDDVVVALAADLAPSPAGGVELSTPLKELGFDSLSYAELAAAVQQELGVDMILAGHPDPRTVGDVVRAVTEAADADPEPRVRIPAGTGRIQGLAKLLAGRLSRWYLRMEVRGDERMPRAGPVVLCMNHESFLDIPLIVIASPRPITFMAKKELFRLGGDWFFRQLGGFPVDRDRFDLPAVDVALAVLERGGVLGMYPEGTRRAGVLLPFLPGAAWLALRTGAPLLPAAIRGTDRAMPPGQLLPRRIPVRISFGEPIPVDRVEGPRARREEAERLTAELREAVRGLLGRG